MSGFRAYFENLGGMRAEDAVTLSYEESRHLCGALRARQNDAVRVFDMEGNIFDAFVSKVSPKSAELRLLEKVSLPRQARIISIAQCMPKGGTFDTIIDQSVQIGLSKIYPLISARTLVRLDSSDGSKKRSKWTSRVIEAVKQSANMRPTFIEAPTSLENFLAKSSPDTLKLVASLQECKTKPLLKVLEKEAVGSKEICVLVGPEGDLSASEYASAYAAGFIPVSLGANVMKCDVAAAFCASVLSAFLSSKDWRS